MSKVNDVLLMFNNFSKEELKEVSKKLLQLLSNADGVTDSIDEKEITCRKCGSSHVIKFGKDAKGNQRYRCKSCNTSFTATSYSVISKTQQSLDVWEKYIQLLLEGASLTKCANACGISVRTSFIWRHKILHALQKDQSNRVLGGIIELDETFFTVSYKGNHKKSNRFTMPRPRYRRGSDNRYRMWDMACVMCAYERGGQSYSEVMGKGISVHEQYAIAFKDRIMHESLVISDKAHGIKKYFNTVPEIELVQMQSHKVRQQHLSPPEVRGIYHIQNINNMHHRLRKFLEKYNGVSTKYLNHYISLFIWNENHKKIKDVNLVNELKECVRTPFTYIAQEDIFNLPPIPQVG